MIDISEYGIKIKNMKAGMIYDVNLGIRDYYTATDAMLNNSLFQDYLNRKKLIKIKGESTRDLICLDFDYGSKDCDTELKKIQKMKNESETEQRKEMFDFILEKVENNRDKYCAKDRDAIRKYFYENGVDVTYTDSKGKQETIHYKMLFRTPAKAKLGQCIFINEKAHEKASKWLTMGLNKKMGDGNAKIVELSAYAPLTTSTIVDRVFIPVKDVLIVEDQDSFFKTMTNVVSAVDYVNAKGVRSKKCIVTQKESEVKNTLWDGMAIIEKDVIENTIGGTHINGMGLLRNHFFKACALKGYLQKFFQDWCKENGYDYETYEVNDIFGVSHRLKDIKMVTTQNAIKWLKFKELMGRSKREAYEYWCRKINTDGNIWGIVKTDHPSKLGRYQQMSYQMVNTLPSTKEDIYELCQTSMDYIWQLKNVPDSFVNYLRKNANAVNHFQMMADMYDWNHGICETDWWKAEKKLIINNYINKLRNGKITVNADNLTMFGNPYALLLHTVGDDWRKDPCFPRSDDIAIQCYTKRFDDGEYLCGIRNPQNSPENIAYLHNTYNEMFDKYFCLSENIVAVNCIGTDIQDRMNGADFDLT